MNRHTAIILVSPENPDNIGAVARAMKNMGLSDLRLVNPPSDWKSKGRKLAMSAVDTLESSRIFKTLKEALGDIHFVVGTTRRRGPRRGLFVDFQKGIDQIKEVSSKQSVGILFGKESKGLDNRSLALCDWVLSIPSDEAYPSLNLSQAVMVVAFSLFSEKTPQAGPRKPLLFCKKEQIDDALVYFEQALKVLDYEKGKGLIPRIMTTMHGIFKRNGMLEPEAQMIKGFSQTIIRKMKKAEEKSKKSDRISTY